MVWYILLYLVLGFAMAFHATKALKEYGYYRKDRTWLWFSNWVLFWPFFIIYILIGNILIMINLLIKKVL